MARDRHPAQGTPWQFRCPEGHASIELFTTTFRCRACDESYDKGELVDLAEEAQQGGGAP